MLADFHIHSIYSDGELIPSEIVTRYKERGFDKIAITDHIDHTNTHVLKDIRKVKNKFEGIDVLVGAELTHVSPTKIPDLSRKLKKEGADLIIVHGESPVEPVQEGTNREAVNDQNVDILAHPGCIDPRYVKIAQRNNVFLELTARRGHCLANGYVAGVALDKEANILVNTDAHSPSDFLTKEKAFKIAKGAGLREEKAREVIEENPKKFSKKID